MKIKFIKNVINTLYREYQITSCIGRYLAIQCAKLEGKIFIPFFELKNPAYKNIPFLPEDFNGLMTKEIYNKVFLGIFINSIWVSGDNASGLANPIVIHLLEKLRK